MKLLSFSFFLFLVQTFPGIEGDVRCADNHSVPNCRLCLLASPPAPLGIDRQNCNASPDCMLSDNGSQCVRKRQTLPTVPEDAEEDSNTAPTGDDSSSEDTLAPSTPEDDGEELLLSGAEDIGQEPFPTATEDIDQDLLPIGQNLLPTAPADIGQGYLSMIKVSLTPNVDEPIRQYGVQVQVCNGVNCCRTDAAFSRGGILTFASAFDNFRNCGQLRRRRDLSVAVVKSSQEYYLVDPLSVTITFGDGSAFRKQNVISCGLWSSWSCRPGFRRLQWGVLYTDMQQTRSQTIPTQAVPAPRCPEVTNPNANACPRANVRVHEVLQQEWRSCYYQRCETVATDLSRIPNGEDGLGTGGYCAPSAELKPRYVFCCELRSYFTLPTRNEAGDAYIRKNATEIKFPECSVMIEDHPVP